MCVGGRGCIYSGGKGLHIVGIYSGCSLNTDFISGPRTKNCFWSFLCLRNSNFGLRVYLFILGSPNSGLMIYHLFFPTLVFALHILPHVLGLRFGAGKGIIHVKHFAPTHQPLYHLNFMDIIRLPQITGESRRPDLFAI